MMALLARHLLDSTVFALLALLLARLLRRSPAAARHTLLLAAVAKFALPLSAFFALGELLHHLLPIRAVAVPPGALLYTVEVSAAARPATYATWQLALVTLWLTVSVLLLVRWISRLHRSRLSLTAAGSPEALAALQRAQRRLTLLQPITLRISATAADPYLSGIRHPGIVLPETLPHRLTPSELEAVLLHELAHVRRRDNLTLTVARLLACTFWFHPLLWHLERRLRAEAETASDELVLAAGISPETYIQGICKTCRLALLRPLGGRSYFSNSNLQPRLEHIMATPDRTRASRAPRLLAALSLPAVALVTLAAGSLTGSVVQAKSATGTAPAADITCAVAGVHMPLGTVTRQSDRLLVCTTVDGRVRWLVTTDAARDKSKPIIQVDNPPPISCAPGAPAGNLCTCSNLRFSPGAVVDSPTGPLLCPKTGGTWQPYAVHHASLSEPLSAAAEPRTANIADPYPAAPQIADNGVAHPGEGITNPVLIHQVEPEFTEAARKQKVRATALVGLTVGADGVPTDVHILRSAAEGKPAKQREAAATLDAECIKAVEQYRFKPGLRDGHPVPVALKLEVNFQIF